MRLGLRQSRALSQRFRELWRRTKRILERQRRGTKLKCERGKKRFSKSKIASSKTCARDSPETKRKHLMQSGKKPNRSFTTSMSALKTNSTKNVSGGNPMCMANTTVQNRCASAKKTPWRSNSPISKPKPSLLLRKKERNVKKKLLSSKENKPMK